MFNRKKNENLEDIEEEIQQWKMQKKEKVEILVFPGEVEYLINEGYSVIPLLFKVEDVKNISNCPDFIKKKYSNKKKKYYSLKKRDTDILNNHNIKYETSAVILYLWFGQSKIYSCSFFVLKKTTCEYK